MFAISEQLAHLDCVYIVNIFSNDQNTYREKEREIFLLNEFDPVFGGRREGRKRKKKLVWDEEGLLHRKSNYYIPSWMTIYVSSN